MKKIIIEKGEGIAEVIDRMLAVEDSDIMFVVPKGSALAKSASNFRLLKREAGLAGKKIMVESVDGEVLELAEANGIGHRTHGAGVSDIVAKVSDDGDERPTAVHGNRKGAGIKLTVHAEPEESDENEDTGVKVNDDDEEKRSFLGQERFFKPRPASVASNRDGADGEDDEDEAESRGVSGKAIAWIVGIIVVLVVIFYGVTIVFGRAQVSIDFTQTPWSYHGTVVADKSVATTSVASAGGTITIPATVFPETKAEACRYRCQCS